MNSDVLMEKYTRLLLLQPGETLRFPKDIVLYVPIMKRLNEMSDDDIKRRIFPLFIPATSASIKATLAFNELTSPEVIRHKMFEIIVKHQNRVQEGWGLTNDTITKEGMTTDEIQEVLKKKTHHIIPVIASNDIPTLLPLVGPTTKRIWLCN